MNADGSATATYSHDGSTYTDSLTNIEGIIGSNGDDTITGNDSNNALLGWHGYDTIYGMGGDDHLASGYGGARLEGGDGNDTYYYAYNEVVTILDSGGDGDEIIITARDMDGTGYWSDRTYYEGSTLVFESNVKNDTADNELIILNGSEIAFITWRAADGSKVTWGEINPFDGSSSYTSRMFAHDDVNLDTYLLSVSAADPPTSDWDKHCRYY